MNDRMMLDSPAPLPSPPFFALRAFLAIVPIGRYGTSEEIVTHVEQSQFTRTAFHIAVL